MSYRCRVHAKELVSLLCNDCDSPVCLDCLTTSHAGHKLCKLSECIEETINQLNEVIEGNESARFSLKKIEENLQNNQDRLKRQVEEMIQRVTEREGEIVKEVKNVCQQTIEQIKHHATELKNPMKNDEETLSRFKDCDKFQKENEEEFVKSIYFYNELTFMQYKYIIRDQKDVPFTLETRDISAEKIVELVGSVLTNHDEHSSSDEDSENIGILPILHETIVNNESLPHQYKKEFTKLSFDDIVLESPEKKFLCCEENLYHLTKTNVNKLAECVHNFTYVPDTNEIIYVLENQASKIFRRRVVSEDAKEMLFIMIGNEKALCIEHDLENYLIILSESIQSIRRKKSITDNVIVELRVRFMDEMGCLTKPTDSFQKARIITYSSDRIKICMSSFVQISMHSIIVYKGFTFDVLFSYSGSIGCEPSLTFSPADVCRDSGGNFLVIDSRDNTVHFLDPKGKFLRIIMSAEDGLSGIERIAMDSLGWLWIGCDDGTIHFAHHQHFKSTTRHDRYLETLKDKEEV